VVNIRVLLSIFTQDTGNGICGLTGMCHTLQTHIACWTPAGETENTVF